jgi:hypothetical protein
MEVLTFDDFVASNLRNLKVTQDGLTLYVRRPFGKRHNADFELAGIDAFEPGAGALTAFMNKYSERYTFFVENILEPRLVPFFEKFGYRVVGVHLNDPDCCMIPNQCYHYKDDIPAIGIRY